MKSVLFGFEVPNKEMARLSEEFANSYTFQAIDPHRFDSDLVRKAEVLVLQSANQKLLSQASACKWIHVFNAGVDDYLSWSGFKGPAPPTLTNSSGIYGRQISEHVFAMILALTRGMRTIMSNQEKKKWTSPQSDGGDRLIEIGGWTMCVAGTGNIGLEVAKKAKGFGMTVLGVKRGVPPGLPSVQQQIVDEFFTLEGLGEALSRSDVVVNLLPLTRETRGVFNSDRFARLKRGAMFVSVGRGATVGEEDLVGALQKGMVGSAGLDVFESEPLPDKSPLWKMKNVIVSPHCAGNSDKVTERAFAMLRENLRKYSNGEQLLNVVDLEAGY